MPPRLYRRFLLLPALGAIGCTAAALGTVIAAAANPELAYLPFTFGALALLLGAPLLRGFRCFDWFTELRGYRRFGDDWFSVYLSPEAQRTVDGQALLKVAYEEACDLAMYFGWKDWPEPEIVAVMDGLVIDDLTRVPNSGACAVAGADTAVLESRYLDRATIRHELAHLFAFRWSIFTPTLFVEGLATYLGDEKTAEAIPRWVFKELEPHRSQLPALLSHREFHREEVRGRNYAWAGSFVGYLIRRYGWEKFRKLYRRSHAWNTHAAFQRIYGFSLESAERRWKRKLMAEGE